MYSLVRVKICYWDFTTETMTYICTVLCKCHHNAIILTYLEYPGNCTSGELRLRGGTTPMEGRVEICINRIWGTICDTFWNYQEAQVVCRQLGFPSIGELLYSKHLKLLFQYPNTYTLLNSIGGCRTSIRLRQCLRNSNRVC